MKSKINSELNSDAKTENLKKMVDKVKTDDKGHRGETLRPSERETDFQATQIKPEGDRTEKPARKH